MLLLILAGLALGYFVWSLVALELNYRRAAAIGITRVRLPIDSYNVIWVVMGPYLWQILDRLPINLGNLERFGRRGWQFWDKADAHLEYGNTWALVTPVNIYVQCADSHAVHDIFNRRMDFIRPSQLYDLLAVYGPCISSVGLRDWPRHRKVLAAHFNENIMNQVWDESVSQSTQMLEAWTNPTLQNIPSIAKDTRTVSLNVLAATGFSRPHKFVGSHESKPDLDEEGSYQEALQIVLDNCILLMLIPPNYLTLPFLPKSLRLIGKAAVNFRTHIAEMLTEEMAALNDGKPGSRGLMTLFVRAIDTKQKEDAKYTTGSSVPKGLSVEEVFGNTFVVNFAGHDTTANTLGFVVYLLTAYPEVQNWVREELQQVIPASGKWNYNDLFPMLKRCRALLLETLRLFPPVIAVQKFTNDHPQTLNIEGKTIVLPPNIGIYPRITAIQSHPKYWRDPLVWKPSRWIVKPSNESHDIATRLKEETILIPAKGTFVAWSDGPQNCLGAKFSQVEFVAIIARLLWEHHFHAIPNGGETPEDTQKRILAATNDIDLKLLVRMKNCDVKVLGNSESSRKKSGA
ncbi:hypothetical protein FQN57_002867 [Myotisia sp. PD_48]|nr:hypothetical protein FQN57_002867 [Myotisia sp. PD_48]